MKIYVEAKSRASLNRRLDRGEHIIGENYSMWRSDDEPQFPALDDTLPVGTVIAIYSQMSFGNPVAKSWGTWNGRRAV